MPSYYSTLFVPLEIGKNVNWLAAYASFELVSILEPLAVRSDRRGFEQVTSLIDSLLNCGQYERLVLGHEPTGVYHEAWARALAERYAAYRQPGTVPLVEYRFVNPLLSKRQRETNGTGRKRKTDKIDLKAIALCLREGQGQPAFLPSEAELRFQVWGRRYRQLHQQQRQVTVWLLTQLDRLWPGAVVNLKRFHKMHPTLEPPVPLVLSKPLERARVRAILSHCPNPHDFLALGLDGIQAFFRQHLGRCGPATAQAAYQLVCQALLPPADIAQVLAQQLQADFQLYLELEQQELALQGQANSLVPGSPAEVLTTIGGISSFLAARYLAYLGHPQRFERAAQVWAFAGFDPITEESGDFRRIGHISRKGQPGLRDTLFLIGLHTAKRVPAIAAAKERALKRGLGFVGATLHAAHKANRLCHHLLYHQIPFDPSRSR
jgi:transposase